MLTCLTVMELLWFSAVMRLPANSAPPATTYPLATPLLPSHHARTTHHPHAPIRAALLTPPRPLVVSRLLIRLTVPRRQLVAWVHMIIDLLGLTQQARNLSTSPHISPHLPTSPHISPHLPSLCTPSTPSPPFSPAHPLCRSILSRSGTQSSATPSGAA